MNSRDADTIAQTVAAKLKVKEESLLCMTGSWNVFATPPVLIVDCVHVADHGFLVSAWSLHYKRRLLRSPQVLVYDSREKAVEDSVISETVRRIAELILGSRLDDKPAEIFADDPAPWVWCSANGKAEFVSEKRVGNSIRLSNLCATLHEEIENSLPKR